MRKLVLIVQTSFDGFVSGPNGEFDNFIGGEDNLGFVCSLIDEGDAILSGRVSYELLNSNWPTAADKPDATKNTIKYSNWYNSVSKFVVSTTLKETNSGNTTIIQNNMAAEIEKLKHQEGKNIFIFGSPTLVHSLLELNLLDEICLIFHPVFFGEGVPLFKDTKKVIPLSLLNTTQLSNGTLGLIYSLRNIN